MWRRICNKCSRFQLICVSVSLEGDAVMPLISRPTGFSLTMAIASASWVGEGIEVLSIVARKPKVEDAG